MAGTSCGDCKHESCLSDVLLQDAPKGLAVAGAVPASETELELTFSNPQSCASGKLCHYFRLRLAQLGLSSCQPPGLPADAGRIHDQGAAHGPGKQNFRTMADGSMVYKMASEARQFLLAMCIDLSPRDSKILPQLFFYLWIRRAEENVRDLLIRQSHLRVTQSGSRSPSQFSLPRDQNTL